MEARAASSARARPADELADKPLFSVSELDALVRPAKRQLLVSHQQAYDAIMDKHVLPAIERFRDQAPDVAAKFKEQVKKDPINNTSCSIEVCVDLSELFDKVNGCHLQLEARDEYKEYPYGVRSLPAVFDPALIGKEEQKRYMRKYIQEDPRVLKLLRVMEALFPGASCDATAWVDEKYSGHKHDIVNRPVAELSVRLYMSASVYARGGL